MMVPPAAPPSLSVVIPVLDVEPELLREAVASVLAEDPVRIREVILVDDGSRDPQTLAALAALPASDPRIALLRTTGRQGPGTARNLGAARAGGEWLAFCDSDDLWQRGRLALLDSVLAADADATWVAANYESVFPDGETSRGTFVGTLFEAPAVVAGDILRAEGDAVTRVLLGRTELHHCACCVRADAFRAVGGYGEGLLIGEDLLLLLRLSRQGALHCADRVVYRYRRERPSIMSSPARLRHGFVPFYARAAREPVLRPFRRQIRWARYSAEKARALHNLIAGYRWRSLRMAFQAWLTDPRSWRDLLLFLRLWRGGPAHADREGDAYSRAERFRLRSPR
jgi:glycosyltransferase involved in cell wall biosynthesis